MSYGVPKTQDVTIITTGSILSIFGTSYPANSRINTISWGPYQDWAVWNTQDSLSVNGVHYSHNNMLLENDSVYTSFMSTSNYICNGNMELLNWDQCHVTYNYSPRSANGDLPPGFEFLGTDNGTPKLIKWSE